MKTKELIFSHKMFPVSPGFDLRVVWDIKEDEMGGHIDASGCYGWINLHPYSFVKVVQEFYGPDRALDFLKIFMHDRVDNLADTYFKPLFDKIDRRYYGKITREMNEVEKRYRINQQQN